MAKKVKAEEKEAVEEIVDEIVEEVQNTDSNDYDEVPVEVRISNIEKKINWILVILIITCIISFAGLFVGGNITGEENPTTSNEQEELSGYDTSNFKTINPSEIKEDSKSGVIAIMIGRQSCGYCASFAPILEKVAKEFKVTARYVDLESMLDLNSGSLKDQAEYDAWISLKGSGYETFNEENFGRTPQTIFVKNNKIVYAVSGYVEQNELEDAFVKAGLSK